MTGLTIVTPTAKFPDPNISLAVMGFGFHLVGDTVGQTDVIEEMKFESGQTSLRYLREPELEIPVITIQGPRAEEVRSSICEIVSHVSSFTASIGYDPTASETVRFTTLRIISAHALEAVTEPMVRVAALAALDPSPYIRLGVVQLLQYAHEETIAGIVRRNLLDDVDPDVSEFARSVLARFDAAAPPGSPET